MPFPQIQIIIIPPVFEMHKDGSTHRAVSQDLPLYRTYTRIYASLNTLILAPTIQEAMVIFPSLTS